jgi:riboflavin kinase / FMN adenylyltransferase
MFHYHSLDDIQLRNTWLTIGAFDGVHSGHQEIIQHLVTGAKKASTTTVVLTFYPHPAITLGKRQGALYLTTPDERARLMGELGVDIVITQKFDLTIASLSAEKFITWAKERLDFSHLVVGYDFALGRGREGNVIYLEELGHRLGYTLDVFEPIWSEGEKVSSSQVRMAIQNGEVEKAARLLGRPYSLDGPVIHGDGRGKTIGIPTANLDFWSELVIPQKGVYACLAVVDGRTWKAVTNIGYRPTFYSQTPAPVIETHLLDLNKDLYGKEIKLNFIARLRDEQKFSGVDALVEQIGKDIIKSREILAALG